MSRQALDLRRSVQILWQHKVLTSVVTALGLLAGIVYTVLSPPVYLSSALVVLSPLADMNSQAVVVTSAPVLSLALPKAGPGMSINALHSRIQATHAATALMSVSAYGTTPAQAVDMANAVASSYVAYVSSASNLAGPQQAQVFQTATTATGTPLAVRLFYAAGAGALSGALVGAVIALAIGRNDGRLRERDELADSIGVPVLASVRVGHPAKAAGWTKLLRDYEPGEADAWRLRALLRRLGVGSLDRPSFTAAGGFSLAVLSVSGDRRALALGPQLAAFAASLGIPTALVIGPEQHATTMAALRTACAAVPEPRGPGDLYVTVSDEDGTGKPTGNVLTVAVSVVDGQVPSVASTMRATATVLGVASGAVTAQQLARVAASAAGDGRDIAGIVVANPDPADQTTGRLPQLARTGLQRMPRRITGAVTEIVS